MLVPEGQRDRANGIREIGFPLAGTLAAVFTGFLYIAVGVIGVMLLDLLTFIVALLVISRIHIPAPAQSGEGQGSKGWWRRDLLAGWLFLWQRRALFLLAVYISFVWFLINGPLTLATPYILAVTGSEAVLGILLGAFNFGAFAGAALLALLGKVQNRVRVIMLCFLLHGLMLVAWGLLRHPLVMGLILILLMAPLPVIGALFATILQNKTPPAMQGRVFGATNQMGVLLTPLSFLITAALVDYVLEPAAAADGMAAVLIAVGLMILVSALLVYARSGIRHLEVDLPDYEAAET
jgi:hypothetical protein